MASAPAATVPLRAGTWAQTWDTMRTMRQVARASALRPELVAAAAGIATDAGINGRDPQARALALRAWLAQRVAFLPDPAVSDTETLRTPLWMLDELRRRGEARGDCDDVATLAAALAAAMGTRCRFRALAWDGRFAHVYTEALDDDGHPLGIDFDATARGHELARSLVSHTLILDV